MKVRPLYVVILAGSVLGLLYLHYRSRNAEPESEKPELQVAEQTAAGQSLINGLGVF